MENFGQTNINLDKENSTLKISGISMMEDAIDFYRCKANNFRIFSNQ